MHPVITGIQPMTAMKHIIGITALTQIVPLPKIIRRTVMLSTLPEQPQPKPHLRPAPNADMC